jgi:hypothetical protein
MPPAQITDGGSAIGEGIARGWTRAVSDINLDLALAGEDRLRQSVVCRLSSVVPPLRGMALQRIIRALRGMAEPRRAACASSSTSMARPM